MPFISVTPYEEELMERANAIQSSVCLPPQLDSPFFVARMLRAHDDEEGVRRAISDILLHRRLVGYDSLDEDEIVLNKFKHVYERFAISRLKGSPRSGNVHVFVQKMKDVHLREILSIFPGSNILHAYYALQDIFSRHIAATEKETGQPSAIVTILDLTGMNLSEFINPLSVNCKLARLIVHIWAEYFSETLVRILLINPPGIVSLMWQITKHIVDARTANRLVFLTDISQLHDHLEPQAIPCEYGGEWRDSTGFADPPEGCSNRPLLVQQEDVADHHFIWKEHEMKKGPHPTTVSIKSRKHADITCCASGTGSIVYSFTTSGDVLFSIHRIENGKEIDVWPPVRLTSLTVPEQSSVSVTGGEFIFRFVNPTHSWMATKVHLSTLFIPA